MDMVPHYKLPVPTPCMLRTWDQAVQVRTFWEGPQYQVFLPLLLWRQMVVLCFHFLKQEKILKSSLF